MLELSDISHGISEYNCKEDKISDALYLRSDQATNNIVYTTISHNIDFLNDDEIKNLPILLALIASLDTKKYSYQELDNEIYIASGGISFSCSTYKEEEKEEFKPRLNIKFKVLEENFHQAIDLIIEIIKNTKFDDKKELRKFF